MKAAPRPVAPTRSSRIWPTLFALSLAGNIALAWLVFRPEPSPPAPATNNASGASPSTATPARSVRPARELAPYAALGSFVAENNRVADLKWSEAQFAAFAEGIRASYAGRGYPLDEDARKLRDEISARVEKMLATERPDPIEDYFRNLRERENVQPTASGLHYRITEEGAGKTPANTATVVISYAARLPDGKVLPSLSRTRVRAAIGELLPGLQEGLQLLRPGGKALVYLPPALSFGGGEWPADLPHGAPVVFFVELHEVVEP